MNDITHILSRIDSGDPTAAEKLLPLMYDELRKLAVARMTHEKPGQTLQATALVHEAYVKLVDVAQAGQWQSRGHFFAAAAEAMRQILVNNAVRKRRAKHGGDLQRVPLNADLALDDQPDHDLIALDEALSRLATIDPDAAQVVQLKYFAGLTIAEIAELLNISSRTADRRWSYARAWLRQELRRQ